MPLLKKENLLAAGSMYGQRVQIIKEQASWAVEEAVAGNLATDLVENYLDEAHKEVDEINQLLDLLEQLMPYGE